MPATATSSRHLYVLDALDGELDGRIEGLTLAETSIDFGEGDERLPPADVLPFLRRPMRDDGR